MIARWILLALLIALPVSASPGTGDPAGPQAAPQAQAAEAPIGPVLLDTDIGTDIDDAWALGFAARSPRFRLVAVTITDGDTASRARVALKLLHRIGRDDVPVGVGRRTPVPEDRVDYQFTWAEDFDDKAPAPLAAADLIVEVARKYQGELTIVAVGPLQNLADALRKEPRLGTLVKRVVLMSGSIYASAWHPYPIAEWNVVQAVADAQLVYSSGLPLTIVPLDATTYVTLRDKERERLRTHPSPLAQSLEALYRLWIESPSSRMTLHDQLALAEAAEPGRFFGRQPTLPIRVDEKGYTRIDESNGKPVTVCLEPRRDEFMDYYLSVLTSPPSR